MAHQTGTADNYKHLLTKLRKFITANNWVSQRWQTSGTGAIIKVQSAPNEAGSGYAVNDVLNVVQTGGSGATVRVLTVGGGGNVLTLELVAAGSGYMADSGVTTSGGTGTGCTIEFEVNGEYELIAKGTGLESSDEIYIGIKTFSSDVDDYYNWLLSGFLGFNSDLEFNNQPGGIAVTPERPRISLFNDAIQYWFIADGRRVIVIAKVSTVYQAAYLGLLNPYLPPSIMPYPLVVAGTHTGYSGERWSIQNATHSLGIMQPNCCNTSTTESDILANPRSSCRFWNGEWHGIQHNYVYTGLFQTDWKALWPYCRYNHARFNNLRSNINDGTYTLLPVILHMNFPSPNIFGELDGVFFITGFNNAAENIHTIGGKDYLVVPNVYRSGIFDYCAVRLS